MEMEKVLFDRKLPDSMPGDPDHPDRFKCHGCDRIMQLIRVNDRVAFYTHQCGMLDDQWVLLTKTSFVKDLYRRMIAGLIGEDDFGTKDKSE